MIELLSEAKVARALLDARNFPGARAKAEKILEDWPDAIPAFTILFGCLAREEKWKESLALTTDWLSRLPKNETVLEAHFVALTRNGKMRQAKKLSAQFMELYPDNKEFAEFARVTIAKASGSSRKMAKALRQARETIGDQDYLQGAELVALYKSGRFGTTKLAKARLKETPLDASLHLALAMEAFRNFRFPTARRHANEMAQLEPERSAQAKEIKIASWAVLFPPFLIGHMFAFFDTRSSGYLGRVFGFTLCLIVTVPLFLILSDLLRDFTNGVLGTKIGTLPLLFTTLVWYGYATRHFPYLWRSIGRKKSVALSSDY